ncbi:hypothetical protein [Heliophilum fasciatum]|uniref:Uncharacterized protein n=1 Tax=Heliophilum fasciatum TaxID=35700 RepID=A0A4R2RCU4_9FIRM|nr:hypothetical protein [Heliophilum fasciatum]MCW2279236.1 hypothetical protein [Heliophilum fasciatum]TCP60633.1 hypothetical protein EDD73_13521 [Heliophilum fasciatum]
MINNTAYEIRRNAFKVDATHIIQAYLKTEGSLFRDQFIELIQEAYLSYVVGCSRASIITSGEALLRLLLHKIDDIFSYIRISDKEAIEIKKYHYATVINVLSLNKVYPSYIIQQMRNVKDLRNIAAHGEYPVLIPWDPDDGRDVDEIIKLFKGEIKIPEAYVFHLNNVNNGKKPKRKVGFDTRKYSCSFKNMRYQDRYAAIQYLFVIEIMSFIYSSRNNLFFIR